MRVELPTFCLKCGNVVEPVMLTTIKPVCLDCYAEGTAKRMENIFEFARSLGCPPDDS